MNPSGVETNQADQTPVDSHAEDGETGAVCPKTTSPTDTQERETIARELEEQADRTLAGSHCRAETLFKAVDLIRALSSELSEREAEDDPLAEYKAMNARLAADLRTALRSNPQPGEVERLRAYAASCERTTQDMIATTAKHFAEVERLRSELKQAQLERDDALDRVDELEKDAEIVSVEFEKDCWVAMRSLLQQVGWDDFSEGVTADMAREIVSDEIKRLTALTPSESQSNG